MAATLGIMYRTEGGFSALYRGIIPTVAGVAPYVGLNFMVYESVRQYFTPDGLENPTNIGKLGAGAISGAVAQSITYPLFVTDPSRPRYTRLTKIQRCIATTIPDQHHVRHGIQVQVHL